jgi:hypothetical protein
MTRWLALAGGLLSACGMGLLVLPYPYRRARMAYNFCETIVVRLHGPESSFAGFLMRGRPPGAGDRPSPFDLPPRAARQLAIASVVGVGGYPAAAGVALLFGVIGWLGFRRARDTATLKVRVLVVGMRQPRSLFQRRST